MIKCTSKDSSQKSAPSFLIPVPWNKSQDHVYDFIDNLEKIVSEVERKTLSMMLDDKMVNMKASDAWRIISNIRAENESS